MCASVAIVENVALFELTLRNKLSSAFSGGELELTDQCLASGFLVSDTTDSWL